MQDPPLPDEANAWSEFGTLCHTLLEEYSTGKLSELQLAEEYEKRYYDAVIHYFPPFPKGYADKTYQQGLDYFRSFDGFGDQYEIVSAEEKFETTLGPYPVIGISDLVLQNKETGGLIVVDHKTKSPSSMKRDYPLYRNQLYIYAAHVNDKYGQWPEALMFNMLKDPSTSIREEFDPIQMGTTINWVEESIDNIYMEDYWPATKANEIAKGGSDYFCQWICPVFQYCQEAQDAIRSKGR